jgi:acyl-CoA thioester hydrolase
MSTFERNEDMTLCGHFTGRRHFLPVRIYYEDTDFTGMVYHANYLRYLERGRSDFLRLAGVSHRDLLALDPPLAFTIQRIELDFRKPGRIDDLLTVVTRYTVAKGARIVSHQKIIRPDRDGSGASGMASDGAADALCEAWVYAAVIDLDGRPRRLPRDMAAYLADYVDGS